MQKHKKIETTDTCKINAELSRSRTFIMGIAMILIMLFHNSFGVLGKIGMLIGMYGHWGVDVFLFLSGFGLFFSLRNDKEKSLVGFYMRRMMRILPAAIISGCCLYVLGKTNFWGLLGLNLWYIRTILILYMVAPVIYWLITVFSPCKTMFFITLFSLVGLLVSVPYFAESSFTIQSAILWTLARIPVFALGMIVAHVDWDSKKLINMLSLMVSMVILGCVLYLHALRAIKGSFSDYLHLLPYMLLAYIVPVICLFIGRISLHVPRFIRKGVELFGIFSLEIYLVHEAVFADVVACVLPSYIKFAIGYGLSVVLALILHFFVALFCGLIKNSRISRSLKE